MPITGLTDRTPSFKEIGRLRLGIPRSEAAAHGPKEISYFRADFRPDALDAYTAFVAAYGDKPVSINIRLPFEKIDRCWDAYYEAYNTSGMLGKADGERWLYLRNNKTGELLVRDGIPSNSTGLPIDANGLPYMPFDKTIPVYSYKSKKGEDVAVFAKATGRLKALIPELKRAAYVQVITHSVYNIIHISEQLAGVEAIGKNIGMALPAIPMVLTRRKELISVTINGKKAMQEKYLCNIEIDPLWMEAQFNFLNAMLPGGGILQQIIAPKLPAGDFTSEDLSENESPVPAEEEKDDFSDYQESLPPSAPLSPAVPPPPAEPPLPTCPPPAAPPLPPTAKYTRKAVINTAAFFPMAARIAEAFPEYQIAETGKPDIYHIEASLAKLGFAAVTDANLAECEQKLTEHALAKRAVINTAAFFPMAARIAEAFPEYQIAETGKPDICHIEASLAKLGFAAVIDANLAECEQKLTEHALAKRQETA